VWYSGRLERDVAKQGASLRLFLGAVEQCLRAHSPGSGRCARIGAIAFIHRFGSALNAHLHFHCVVIDGVFAPTPTGGAVFHPTTAIDAPAIATLQAKVRRRLLASVVRRGLLAPDDAQAMAQWAHGGGFSVDASVRIEAADRAGRERLLRYCARPPFALQQLHELGFERLRYDPPTSSPDRGSTLIVTPLELLDRLAALVPPPRVHRHRYYGVLAPNAPLRQAATAMGTAPGPPAAAPNPPPTEPAPRRAARYAWARLLARIRAMSALRSLDADRCLHHQTRDSARDPRLPRRADPPTDHCSGSRPAAMGHARGRTGAFRPLRPTRASVRNRSTHCLVTTTRDRS
jgi:hypothetical protein